MLENGKTDCSKIPEATKCLGFRQTKGCDPNGDRDDSHDSGCDVPISYGRSGYCECGGGRRVMEVSCEHSHFTCESACWKNSGNETVGKTFLTTFYASAATVMDLQSILRRAMHYFFIARLRMPT